ncbi:MAG: hypothetical protein QOF29_3082 [bacterium]
MNYASFIAAVEQDAHIPRKRAEQAARATLATLDERLAPRLARDVAARLPDELRPLLATETTAERFDSDEFVYRVARREGMTVAAAERDARAVFAALGQAVSAEELADVASELPTDFQRLVVAAELAAIVARSDSPRRMR